METELPAFLADAFSWLERTSFAETVRTVPRLYPVLMSLHVLGIALLVGPAFAVDLRLLGVGRRLVFGHARGALPSAFVPCRIRDPGDDGPGHVYGGCGDCRSEYGGILEVGPHGANILVFHKGIYRSVASWDLEAPHTIGREGRGNGVAASWTGTIFAGRLLAY
jgi:hypothetical protein